MLHGATYAEVCQNFQWRIPQTYNIGVDVCDKWAHDPQRLALIYVSPDETEIRFSFAELKKRSNQLANALRAHGIARGDRVGILLPQCPETLISHIAVYKLGAIAVPLLTLFGTMAIEYRLQDSAAKTVITGRQNLPELLEMRTRLPQLEQIIVIDAPGEDGLLDFWQSLEKGSSQFLPEPTGPDDPALIIYTSGTTGQPKGTLHAHRLLLGILPGFEFYHNLFPQAGDLMYSPLDWAYIGGSFDSLFPALHHGVPVLAYRPPKFDPEKAFYMMAKYWVRNLMVVPTVLRMMMNAVKNPRKRYHLNLRSATAGGETLGNELYDWSRHALGVDLNEQYGQTECDLVIGFCCEVMQIARGAIGKPTPGHQVAILNTDGHPAPAGDVGEIVVKRPDPVMFLQYWNKPEATADKFTQDWMRTGDFGRIDETGHFWFTGRQDDLIESGGYRIGPGEIETCLMAHPEVALVCVLGVPDTVRGEIVKAFIVPHPWAKPQDTLETDIREWVKGKLEAHAYPREIQFMEQLPMTKTGKIRKDKLRRMERKA